jgi:hypothetical protein
MTIVSLLSYDTDIRVTGLEAGQGLMATQTYYWESLRAHARFQQPHPAEDRRPLAEHGKRRPLFQHVALSQGSCRYGPVAGKE